MSKTSEKAQAPAAEEADNAAVRCACGRINVVVADDHRVVLFGISRLLEDEPDIHVLAAAVSISELMEALRQASCDVLLCDYAFEEDQHQDGLHLLKRIRVAYPSVRIVLLSCHRDIMIVHRALRIGVSGYLSKASGEFVALPKVIRMAHKGQRYLDHATSEAMIGYLLDNPVACGGAIQLSSREMEVVRLFASGMTVTEIALYTRRSLKTISAQKVTAMKKLGVANDVELLDALRSLA
jgi:two-component system capsular synthesis response regulator RcsB